MPLLKSPVGLTAAVAVLVVAAVVVTSPTQSAEGDAERLLARLYETGRHTSGRLMDHPFAPLAPAPAPDSELALVDAILREGSRTERTDHLQASLQIAGRQWASAAATIEVLRALDPDDPQIANDLDVVYLERGGMKPPYLVDALRLFEFASSIDPLAPEPIFNLALTYRRLHLDEVADGLLSEYQRIDPGSAWLEDIASEVDEAEPGATIRRVPEFSLSAMEEDPDQWWDLVFETALYLDEGRSAPATAPAEFLTAYESRTTDRTLSGIFGPLASPARNTIIAFRRTIQQARTLYAQARFAESIQILEGALSDAQVPALESFDRLWAELILTESLVWAERLPEAVPMLGRVVSSARTRNFDWLLAGALAVTGSRPMLNANRRVSIQRLEEAIRGFDALGMDSYSVRPRVLLAGNLLSEGGIERSFTLAHQALDHIPADNHRQRYQATMTLRINPLLAGTPLGSHYLEAALESVEFDGTPLLMADIEVALSDLYEAESQHDLAERHLRSADRWLTRVESSDLATLILLRRNLTEARTLRGRGDANRGIALLEDGLLQISRLSLNVYYRPQYHLELARAYGELQRFDDAAREFRSAIDAVEEEDSALTAEVQLSFDEFRRQVYEGAIDFEVNRENYTTAWQYVQQYRNKLLSEIVEQYGAESAPVGSPPVEDFLDSDATVVEYTLLPDRVIIWVPSGGDLHIHTVPIDRALLTAETERFLKLVVQARDLPELEDLSRKLYDWLIRPVEGDLGDQEAVVIVPDRILHRLPFQALRSVEGTYLAERTAVAQTPSLAYFLSGRPRRAEDAYRLAAMGSRDQGTSILRELRGIASVYPDVELLNEFAVTRDSFLDAVSDSALLVYAGHSAVDGGSALTSEVRLDGRVDGPNDVTAVEIANRRMAPDALVVLSSCDSSVGNSIGGVGVRGLTSAFLIAGAGAVVGSLWPVESSATADLMLEFHQYVAGGMPIAEALRQAQLTMMAEQSHPYYWSAFNVTGNRAALLPASFVDTVTATAALYR